jgi:hypothetical protein
MQCSPVTCSTHVGQGPVMFQDVTPCAAPSCFVCGGWRGVARIMRCEMACLCGQRWDFQN